MKYLSLLFVALLIGCSNNDKKEISEVFNNFNKGLVEKNGLLIYESSSKQTLAFYDNILAKAKKKEIQGNIVEKMNILSALMMFNNDQLKNISTKDFIISLFKNAENDTDKINAINSMTLNNLVINEKEATATLPGNMKVLFEKENGKWKYDYLTFMNSTLATLEQMKVENNMNDSELISAIFIQNPTIMKKSVRSKAELNYHLNLK